MVVTVGETVSVLDVVDPISVPPQLPEYHTQADPAPSVVGFVTVSVAVPPLQIGEVPVVDTGFVVGAPPTTMVAETQAVLLQVPSALA